jgi:uncharacterized protein
VPTVVGAISDTHGLMRQEALDALAGVSQILHAGDIGAPAVMEALARIAPVIAIRGNVDTAEWALAYPETRTLAVENARIYMIHNLADLGLDPAARGINAVVSGHSHQPLQEERGGVLYLNPGSAGPERFRLPVTVARVVADDEDVRAEILSLKG